MFGEMLHHAAIANHIRWQPDRLLNSIALQALYTSLNDTTKVVFHVFL